MLSSVVIQARSQVSVTRDRTRVILQRRLYLTSSPKDGRHERAEDSVDDAAYLNTWTHLSPLSPIRLQMFFCNGRDKIDVETDSHVHRYGDIQP